MQVVVTLLRSGLLSQNAQHTIKLLMLSVKQLIFYIVFFTATCLTVSQKQGKL